MSNNSFKKNIERTNSSLIENIKESAENSAGNNIENDSGGAVNTDIHIETTQDLLNEVLKNPKKIRSYPHTVYLTEATGDALVKYARKANKSKSAFLEELLSRILVNPR
jgi:hypothetical protein